MRKAIAVLMLLVCWQPVLKAQQATNWLEGKWWLGVIEEAMLPINITFDREEGQLRALLYSPMQSDGAMVATKWSFENDTLRINQKNLGVRITLKWNPKDSTFTGEFKQQLMRSGLSMTPTSGLFVVVRPQTPQRPFPYREEEVKVEHGDVTLTGTLTLPEGEGPWPAVVLVSGSGQQNRDEELMGHKPFLVLSDYLTRHGIAVMRYDDRGVGGSKGEVAKATTLDFADDAEAMFNYLRKHKGIDKKRVGIIGHSEGGMIAPIVAARNRKVSFVVTLGGPGMTGAEVLLQQIRRIMELDGVPERLINLRIETTQEIFEVMDTMPTVDYMKRITEICAEKSKGLTAEESKLAGLRKQDAMQIAMQMQSPWMQTFINLDNGVYLRKTRCRILAINGEKDCQVLPCNLEAIGKVTEGRAELRLMPDLNHLMQHCETGSPREYMTIEETMANEVMEEIVRFVRKGK